MLLILSSTPIHFTNKIPIRTLVLLSNGFKVSTWSYVSNRPLLWNSWIAIEKGDTIPNNELGDNHILVLTDSCCAVPKNLKAHAHTYICICIFIYVYSYSQLCFYDYKPKHCLIKHYLQKWTLRMKHREEAVTTTSETAASLLATLSSIYITLSCQLSPVCLSCLISFLLYTTLCNKDLTCIKSINELSCFCVRAVLGE